MKLVDQMRTHLGWTVFHATKINISRSLPTPVFKIFKDYSRFGYESFMTDFCDIDWGNFLNIANAGRYF